MAGKDAFNPNAPTSAPGLPFWKDPAFVAKYGGTRINNAQGRADPNSNLNFVGQSNEAAASSSRGAPDDKPVAVAPPGLTLSPMQDRTGIMASRNNAVMANAPRGTVAYQTLPSGQTVYYNQSDLDMQKNLSDQAAANTAGLNGYINARLPSTPFQMQDRVKIMSDRDSPRGVTMANLPRPDPTQTLGSPVLPGFAQQPGGPPIDPTKAVQQPLVQPSPYEQSLNPNARPTPTTFLFNAPGENGAPSRLVNIDAAPNTPQDIMNFVQHDWTFAEGILGAAAQRSAVINGIVKIFPLAGALGATVYSGLIHNNTVAMDANIAMMDRAAANGQLDPGQLHQLLDMKAMRADMDIQNQQNWRHLADIWSQMWGQPRFEPGDVPVRNWLKSNWFSAEDRAKDALIPQQIAQVKTQAADARTQAYALLQQPYAGDNLVQANELIHMAQFYDQEAAVYSDPTWSYSLSVDPHKEGLFREALVQAEMQNGAPLSDNEIQQIKNYFINPWDEMGGQMFMSVTSIIPVHEIVSPILGLGSRGIATAGEALVKYGDHLMGLAPVAEAAAEEAAPAALKPGSYVIGQALKGIGSPFSEGTVISSLRAGFKSVIERLPVVGNTIAWLGTETRAAVAERMFNDAVETFSKVANSSDSTATFQNLLEQSINTGRQTIQGPGANAAESAASSLWNKVPASIGLRERSILADLSTVIPPENWGPIIDDVTEKVSTRAYQAEYARLLATGVTETDAAAAAGRFAEDFAANPKNVVREVAATVRAAYLDAHQVAGRILDDNLMVLLAKKLDLWDAPVSGFESVAARQARLNVRNGIQAVDQISQLMSRWWVDMTLRARPGWVFTNMVDSTFRYLISGGKIFDDLGLITATNFAAAKELEFLIPQDLMESFARRDVPIEQSVPSKLLNGWKPEWGPLSFLQNRWSELRPPTEDGLNVLQRWAVKAGDFYNLVKDMGKSDWPQIPGALVKGSGGVLRDAFAAWTGGWTDFNAAMEFTLRLRLFHEHFAEAYGAYNVRVLDEVMGAAQSSPAVRDLVKALWAEAGENPDRMAALVAERLGHPLEGRPLTWSLLVPPDLDKLTIGLSASDRSLFSSQVLAHLRQVQEAAGADFGATHIAQAFDDIRAGIQDMLVEKGQRPEQAVTVDPAAAAAQAAADQEKRVDWALRADLDKLSPDEAKTALAILRRENGSIGVNFPDTVTGFKTKGAWALGVARGDFNGRTLVHMDMAGMGAINKLLGHDAGDDMLKALAKVLRDDLGLGADSYRIHGDEFNLALKMSRDEAELVAQDVTQRFADARISLVDPEGKTHVYNGAFVSYGIGSGATGAEADAAAERGLIEAERLSILSGQRGAKGTVPPGMVELPASAGSEPIAEQIQNRIGAAAQEVRSQPPVIDRLDPIQAAKDLRPQPFQTRQVLVDNFKAAAVQFADVTEVAGLEVPIQVDLTGSRPLIQVNSELLKSSKRAEIRTGIFDALSKVLANGEDAAIQTVFKTPERWQLTLRDFLQNPRLVSQADYEQFQFIAGQLDRNPAVRSTLEGLLGRPIGYDQYLAKGSFSYETADYQAMLREWEGGLNQPPSPHYQQAGIDQSRVKRVADEALQAGVAAGTVKPEAQQAFNQTMRAMDRLQSYWFDFLRGAMPGPRRVQMVDQVAKAWAEYFEYTARSYETVSAWTREVQAATLRGETAVPLSVEDFLKRSGVTLRYNTEGEISSFKFLNLQDHESFRTSGYMRRNIAATFLRDVKADAAETTQALMQKPFNEIMGQAALDWTQPAVQASGDGAAARMTAGVANALSEKPLAAAIPAPLEQISASPSGVRVRADFWNWATGAFKLDDKGLANTQKLVDGIASVWKGKYKTDWYETWLSRWQTVDKIADIPRFGTLTPDAHGLLVKVEAGGVPTQMTSNLLRIAQENGIDASNMTAGDLILELRKQTSAYQTGDGFSSWFRSSQALTDQGTPQVLYHGTTADIKQFDPSLAGYNTGHPSSSLGIWFSEDPDTAASFVMTFGDEPGLTLQEEANIVPVHLSVQKPYEISAEEFLDQHFRGTTPADVQQFQTQLMSQGYDGLHIIGDPQSSPEWVHDNWVIFDPTQAKSVFNTGAYDATDPRLLYHNAPLMQDAAEWAHGKWGELSGVSTPTDLYQMVLDRMNGGEVPAGQKYVVDQAARRYVDAWAAALLPEATPGIQSQIPEGYTLLYRTARSSEEVKAILTAIEDGKDLGAGFRSSVAHIHAGVEAKAAAAEAKGMVPVFASNFPGVAGQYHDFEADLPFTFAIEVPNRAIVYKSTRAAMSTQGAAYSAYFIDTELLFDANRISRMWQVPSETIAKVTDWTKELASSQIKAGAFKNAFRDADPELAAAGAEALLDLREPPKSLGRPFLEAPMSLKEGMTLQKGDRVLLTTGDLVKVKNVTKIEPGFEQFNGGAAWRLHTDKLKNVPDGLYMNELNVYDHQVVRIVPKGTRLPKAELDAAVQEARPRLIKTVLSHRDELVQYAMEAQAKGETTRFTDLSARADKLTQWLSDNGLGKSGLLFNEQPDTQWFYLQSERLISDKLGGRATGDEVLRLVRGKPIPEKVNTVEVSNLTWDPNTQVLSGFQGDKRVFNRKVLKSQLPEYVGQHAEQLADLGKMQARPEMTQQPALTGAQIVGAGPAVNVADQRILQGGPITLQNWPQMAEEASLSWPVMHMGQPTEFVVGVAASPEDPTIASWVLTDRNTGATTYYGSPEEARRAAADLIHNRPAQLPPPPTQPLLTAADFRLGPVTMGDFINENAWRVLRQDGTPTAYEIRWTPDGNFHLYHGDTGIRFETPPTRSLTEAQQWVANALNQVEGRQVQPGVAPWNFQMPLEAQPVNAVQSLHLNPITYNFDESPSQWEVHLGPLTTDARITQTGLGTNFEQYTLNVGQRMPEHFNTLAEAQAGAQTYLEETGLLPKPGALATATEPAIPTSFQITSREPAHWQGPISAQELKWTGLEDYLTENKNVKLKKDDILQYLADHRPDMKLRVLPDKGDPLSFVENLVETKPDGVKNITSYDITQNSRKVGSLTWKPDASHWSIRGADGAELDWESSLTHAQAAAKRQFGAEETGLQYADNNYLVGLKEGQGDAPNPKEWLLTWGPPTTTHDFTLSQVGDGVWNVNGTRGNFQIRLGKNEDGQDLYKVWSYSSNGLARPGDGVGWLVADADSLESAQNALRTHLGSDEFDYSAQKQFHSSDVHTENPIIVHIRTTDRVDEHGDKVLFIEEIQSDWHQHGDEHGYQLNPAERSALLAPFQATQDQALSAMNTAGTAYDQAKTTWEIASAPWQQEHPAVYQFYYDDEHGVRHVIDSMPVGSENTGDVPRHRNELNNAYRHPELANYFVTFQRMESQDAMPAELQALKDAREAAFTQQQNTIDAYHQAQAAFREQEGLVQNRNAVPPGPFSTTYNELAINRMIRHAAENGYDAIGWTTGATQTERWSYAERQVADDLRWNPTTERLSGFKDGNPIQSQVVPRSQLAEYVGNDVANNMFRQVEGGALEAKVTGQDIAVGGQGFVDRYDKQFVKSANKMGAKFNTQVQDGVFTVDMPSENYQPETMYDVWAVTGSEDLQAEITAAEENLAAAEKRLDDNKRGLGGEYEPEPTGHTGGLPTYTDQSGDRPDSTVSIFLDQTLGSHYAELRHRLWLAASELHPEAAGRMADDIMNGYMQIGSQGSWDFGNIYHDAQASQLAELAKVDPGLEQAVQQFQNEQNYAWSEHLGKRDELQAEVQHLAEAVAEAERGLQNADTDLVESFESEHEAQRYIDRHDLVGARIEESTPDYDPYNSSEQQQIDYHKLMLTDEMRASALDGRPLFNTQRTTATAAVAFDRDQKAIIYAVQNKANVVSLVHEVSHILERQLDQADRLVVSNWAGKDMAAWGTPERENFAKAFEKYLSSGQAPTPELEGPFAYLKDWIVNVYRSITNYFSDVKITPELRKVFDSLVAEDPRSAEQLRQALPSKLNQLVDEGRDPLVNQAYQSELWRLMREVSDIVTTSDAHVTEDLQRVYPWWEKILSGTHADSQPSQAGMVLGQSKLPDHLFSSPETLSARHYLTSLINEVSKGNLPEDAIGRMLGRRIRAAVGESLTSGRSINPYVLQALGAAEADITAASAAWGVDGGVAQVQAYLQSLLDSQAHGEMQAAWDAFSRTARYPDGRSLAAAWGAPANSYETFRSYLRDYGERLRTQYGSKASDLIAALDLIDREVASFRSQSNQALHGILPEAFWKAEADLAVLTPAAIPVWKMPDDMRTWLLRTDDLLAQANAALDGLDHWQGYLNGSSREKLLANKLSPSDQALFEKVGDRAVQAKYDLLNTVLYGGQIGKEHYGGVVPMVNKNMLTYNNATHFDELMKNIMPFWMFPKRSLPFWAEYMALNPWLPALYYKIINASQAAAYRAGGTTSNGQQLPSLEGYFPIPGTSLWVNPTKQLSFKYLLPTPGQRYNDAGDPQSIAEAVYSWLRDFGQYFGFSFAPWVSLLATVTGLQDTNKIQSYSLIPELGLIPPWVSRDILEKVGRAGFPGIPGIWQKYVAPEPSFEDYLIERQLLTDTNQRLLDPTLSTTQKYAAVQASKDALLQREANDLWSHARDEVEQQNYYTQMAGFFTGIFGKEWTTANADFNSLRDEVNNLRDTINGEIGASIFGLDPDAEQRYQHYIDRRYNTPEGFLSTLYGTIRFTQTATGQAVYGQERRDMISQTIHEDQVTQSYFDALGALHTQLEDKLRVLPIGSDSALTRQVWDWYFQQRLTVENSPMYADSKRSWVIGYKPEKMLEQHYADLWWQLIRETKPAWDQTGGQTYADYQTKVSQWQGSIPVYAAQLYNQFLNQERANAVVMPKADYPKIEAALASLKTATSYDSYRKWEMSHDTVMDALNAAWRATYWDPYWAAIQDKSGYERQLAETQFLTQHPQPPTSADMVAWVQANYPPGQFAVQDLTEASKTQPAKSIAARTTPKTDSLKLVDEAYNILAMAGPGIGHSHLVDAYVALGGKASDFDVFYETNGAWRDPLALQAFVDKLRAVAQGSGLKTPDAQTLAEWIGAQNMNTDYRAATAKKFGDDIWGVISDYLSNTTAGRAAARKADPRIDGYYAFRDQYALLYPEWAKFYYTAPSKKTAAKASGTGTGAAAKKKAAGGGGGGGKVLSGGLASGLARNPLAGYLPQGLRTTLHATDLLAAQLGKAGVPAGKGPIWPAVLWAKYGPPPSGFTAAAGQPLIDALKTGALGPQGLAALTEIGKQPIYSKWVRRLADGTIQGPDDGPALS